MIHLIHLITSPELRAPMIAGIWICSTIAIGILIDPRKIRH